MKIVKRTFVRVGEVASLMADAGLVVLTAFISPHRAERPDGARARGAESLLLKCLWIPRWQSAKRAIRKGCIKKPRGRAANANFTGIDSVLRNA